MPVETQETIGRWNRETFPGGDDMGPRHPLRLLEEVVELALAAGASAWEVSNTVWSAVDRSASRYFEGHGVARLHRQGRAEPHKVPGEMADCAILLDVMAARRGVDLRAEVDSKMKTNRARCWSINSDGTGQHLPSEGDR